MGLESLYFYPLRSSLQSQQPSEEPSSQPAWCLDAGAEDALHSPVQAGVSGQQLGPDLDLGQPLVAACAWFFWDGNDDAGLECPGATAGVKDQVKVPVCWASGQHTGGHRGCSTSWFSSLLGPLSSLEGLMSLI